MSEPQKESMHDLFVNNAKMVEKGFTALDSAVKSLMDGNLEETQVNIEKTIQVEKDQDRLREEIIERLFTRETMVFSRPDRLNIVEGLDDIMDKVEITARYLLQYKKIDIPKAYKTEFIKISSEMIKIGSNIGELIRMVLKDFEKAKPICNEIEDVRRNVRTYLWQLHNQLYEEKLDFMQFNYFQNLIKSIRKAADVSEDFSDKIYGLLCKYAM